MLPKMRWLAIANDIAKRVTVVNAAENAVVGDCERYPEACHGRECCRKCGGQRLRTTSRSVSWSRMLPKMRWSAIANDIAMRVTVANAAENAVVTSLTCQRLRLP